MKKSKTSGWWLSVFALASLAGCAGVTTSEPPYTLPEIPTGDPGTSYDRLPRADAGVAVEPDASVGPTDAGTVTEEDAGADAARVPDAGPVQCNPDIFLSSRPGGDIKPGPALSGEITSDCDAVRYSLILPKGQSVQINLWGSNLYAGLHLYGPGRRGYLMETLKRVRGALASLEFTADLPGEYFVVVNQAGRRGLSPFGVQVKCTDRCDLKTTRYPIVFAHGFSGFKNIGPIDYWYNVLGTFGPQGYDLHVAVVDAYNSVPKRGPQLAAVIDGVLASTWANKVNIVGHSQGGLDSRYVISALGYADRVGMLATLASPHHGTAIADLALSDPAWMTALKVLFGAIGIIIEGPDMEHALEASLDSMSTATMAGFNKMYPPDPRVSYKSWACRSCGTFSGACKNPVDIYFLPIYNAIYDRAGDNDGVVPTDSARWEGFQGVLESDHIDVIGQLMGMT
ncbi:MAG: triacylglycerol lipase, partial [Myxococcota bacterium]